MIVATIISLVLSVAAIVISLLALNYARQQTEIMSRQETRAANEDLDAAEWNSKFGQAVDASLKAARGWFVQGGAQTYAYGLVFPDPVLRERIETYLIETDRRRDHFAARQATREHMRMPLVRQTITEVLDCRARFVDSDPEVARKLGLNT